MILFSIILKLVAFQCTGSALAWAAGAWLASLLLDACVFARLSRGAPRRLLRTVGNTLVLSLGSLVFGIFMFHAGDFLTVRLKEGIPAAARVVRLVLNGVGLPFSDVNGTLHLTTMAGNIAMPVSHDLLGTRAALVIVGLGAVYVLLTGRHRRDVAAGLSWYIVIVAVAALLRAALSIGLFVFLCYFTTDESLEFPILPFLRPDVIALTYVPFLLLFAPVLHRHVFAGASPSDTGPAGAHAGDAEHAGSRSLADRGRRAALAYAVLAALLLTAFWRPQGTRKQGTVLINTFHTQWSRTDRAYDKSWFGSASSYNYYCVKTLLSVFYDVKELKTRISAEALADTSVLFIYDPDRPFTNEERDAVRAFVERGGGLLLIGDHTNVFGSSSHLNTICGPFGFQFRDDVLFDQKADFFQILFPGTRDHFLLEGIDIFKLRGPCSIRPTSLFTCPVLEIDHSKSMRAIYSVNNFYPPPADTPAMKTGRFAIAVAAHAGRGRVLAFGDSTIFSQFEIFYPGKYDFLMNGVDWLNHRDSALWVWCRRLAALAAAALALLLLVRTRNPRASLVCCVGLIVLFHAAWHGTNLIKRWRTQPPPVRSDATFLFFVADAEDDRLALQAFIPEGSYSEWYKIFTQWVLRNRMFPSFYLLNSGKSNRLYHHLATDPRANTGLAFIIREREQLLRLRDADPRLFAENSRFLFMAGPETDEKELQRVLTDVGCLRERDFADARPLAGLDRTLEITTRGRTVIIVFEADRFSDAKMGYTEKAIPEQEQKDLHDREYALLDTLFGVGRDGDSVKHESVKAEGGAIGAGSAVSASGSNANRP